MNERLKLLRKTLKMTQIEFGERIGVAGNTVTNYENSMRNPSTAVITSICREFNVNENWLLNGEGEMFNELSQAELVANIVGRAISSNDEFILNTFIALGQLSPAQWDEIKKFVKEISEKL